MRLVAVIVVAMPVVAIVAGCGPTVTPRPAACTAAAFAAGRWIDLTHAFGADTIYWPTEKGFVLEQEFAGPNPKGYYYAANRITTAEHGGTHLDAHVILCGAEVPIFENVTDLSLLPPQGAFVAALPMKIAGGSGGRDG